MATKILVVGGGYIGMEIAAAAVGWNLDPTENEPATPTFVPETQLSDRESPIEVVNLENVDSSAEGRKKRSTWRKVEDEVLARSGRASDGHVTGVKLGDGSIIEADTVVVGIGAKPAVTPFESIGLKNTLGGIQNKCARNFCYRGCGSISLKGLHNIVLKHYKLLILTRSPRKVWWQFFGDNVGETVEVGKFDPKVATFWIDSGKLKGVFLESGSPEKVVLRLEIGDHEKHRKKAMKAVCLPGVVSVAVNAGDKTLTFIGDVDPIKVVDKLKKICSTEIVKIGPET
ncbi:monodehydroascorbate reductase, chloroplastic/mitochondrial-like [Primulina tabacum]|uniref:monodehydroascorbate reductase, chloroplastic/mitochondrial-like n=1 Tax=Primulina tabacum TaxID=48773 RepID=UPI003F59D659